MKRAAIWLVTGGLMFAFLYAVGADSAEKEKKKLKKQEKAKAMAKQEAAKDAVACPACAAAAGGKDAALTLRVCYAYPIAYYESYWAYAAQESNVVSGGMGQPDTCEPAGDLFTEYNMPWITTPGDCPNVTNMLDGCYNRSRKDLDDHPPLSPHADTERRLKQRRRNKDDLHFAAPPAKVSVTLSTRYYRVPKQDGATENLKIKAVTYTAVDTRAGDPKTITRVFAWETDDRATYEPATWVSDGEDGDYRLTFQNAEKATIVAHIQTNPN